MTLSFSRATFFLLLPLLFVHWAGDAASAAYVLCLFLGALIFRLSIDKVSKEAVILSTILLFHLFLVFVLNHPTVNDLLDFSASSYLKLYYQAVSLFLVVILISLLPPMTIVHAKRLLYFFYVVFLMSIVVEWFLVNIFGISNTLMPAYRDSYSYYLAFQGFYRPFGLVGNAPINGCMLVFATWVMIVYVRPSRANYFLLLTLIALLLNNSGQALLAFFITTAMYFSLRARSVIRFLVLLASLCMIVAIIYFNVFSKLSLDYVLYLMEFLTVSIIHEMDVTRIFFGGFAYYKDIFLTTEVYFIYAVERFGLIVTILTWIYIWFRLPTAKKTLFFSALFLGDIHYAMILHIPLLVLFALVVKYCGNMQPSAVYKREHRRNAIVSQHPQLQV